MSEPCPDNNILAHGSDSSMTHPVQLDWLVYCVPQFKDETAKN